MSRVAYVNGRFVEQHAPAINVEDRGFQFADGIYEVWGVEHGALVDSEGHFRRLRRSLRELSIRFEITDAALGAILRETLRRNRVRDGLLYLQITRGAAPRDHAFPPADTPATIVVTAKAAHPRATQARVRTGVRVITYPDQRWARCDIKTVSLLPNVLAKQAAKERGAFEAWLVDADGYVTEGSSSNAWIVTREGVIVTRDLKANILPGVTRHEALQAAAQLGLRFEERAFTVEEAKAAPEAFLTSATNPVVPIIAIDDVVLGAGKPGPIAQSLNTALTRGHLDRH